LTGMSSASTACVDIRTRGTRAGLVVSVYDDEGIALADELDAAGHQDPEQQHRPCAADSAPSRRTARPMVIDTWPLDDGGNRARRGVGSRGRWPNAPGPAQPACTAGTRLDLPILR
jgi:hypothetical protein